MPDSFTEPIPLFFSRPSSDTQVLPFHVSRHGQSEEIQEQNSISAADFELQDLPPSQPTIENELFSSESEEEDFEFEDKNTEEHHLVSQDSKVQMSRSRNKKIKDKSPSRPALTVKTSHDRELNGHANGNMNSHIEMRRKHVSNDSASIKENLMSRDDFTLDNEPPPPPTPQTPGLVTTTFSNLPPPRQEEFPSTCTSLLLQGIPMGLASGSVPFLLKKYLSYGQIGVFSLAIYPYSLKLLWSPIVDAVWSRRFGRRKSWITPIQTVSGMSMIYLGGRIDDLMKAAGKDDGSGVWGFTGWWFLLVFLCATQDIAVDGWAISLLSVQNLAYASTAQTVGLTAGSFLSHTVFLALNAPDFANRWLRNTPQDRGLLTLGGYMEFWGWIYLIVTLGLGVLKKEEKNSSREGIMEVYRSMWAVLKLPNIITIIIIHLISKLGFVTNDAVTNLKLLDKGFGQANLALVVLIDFPFELSLGYYAGKWSTEYTPLRLWCWAYVARLIAAVFAQFTIMIYPTAPTEAVPLWYLLTVIVEHVYSTFMSTIMFVAASAFHARIADPSIGGTYMTLLATVSNLGGTFPRFFLLKLVDVFTTATCIPPTDSKISIRDDPGQSSIITSPFSCALEADKSRCINGGGTCVIQRDGFYITNAIFVVAGAILSGRIFSGKP